MSAYLVTASASFRTCAKGFARGRLCKGSTPDGKKRCFLQKYPCRDSRGCCGRAPGLVLVQNKLGNLVPPVRVMVEVALPPSETLGRVRLRLLLYMYICTYTHRLTHTHAPTHIACTRTRTHREQRQWEGDLHIQKVDG